MPFSIKQFKLNIKTILFILIINIFIFLIIEGAASSFFAFKNFFQPCPPEPNRVHTKYDELLGWISIPNVEVKNLYGSGRYLKTNSQGFRNTHDFSIKVPKEKTRIICSGDSFTLGDGVDNDHTWCESLTKINKSIETINLGQDGYGVDQAYLWYMRDGKEFEHNIHLFAFITDDFFRMKSGNYCGYCKPVLKLVNGKLVVKNFPVPKYSYSFPNLREYLERRYEFKFYEILERVLMKILFVRKNSIENDNGEIKKFSLKIFEILNQTNKEKNSTLVLVHLPDYEDCTNEKSNVWRKWLKDETVKRDIIYIDLIDEFKKVPAGEINSLFRLKSNNHYSIKGNRLVANLLYKKLVSYKVLN